LEGRESGKEGHPIIFFPETEKVGRGGGKISPKREKRKFAYL